MQITEITQAYKSSAEWSKFSKNTVALYSSYLNRLEELGKDLPVTLDGIAKHYGKSDMQLPVAVALYVADWQRRLEAFEGHHAQNMARRVLINLFSWAKSYGFPVVEAVANLVAPRVNKTKDHRPFDSKEIRTILALLQKGSLGAYEPYIRSAVAAFHTGLRPSEVEGLKWEDVGEDLIAVKSAKWKEEGKISRYCKITPEIREVLPERRSPEEFVFRSIEGRRLNKDMRSRAIHSACRSAGVGERDFYSTRRGTATEMFRNGYSLLDISKQLGHESTKTTEIYIQLTMTEAANRFRGVLNDKV